MGRFEEKLKGIYHGEPALSPSIALKRRLGDMISIEIQATGKQLWLSGKNEVTQSGLDIKKGTGLNGLQSRIRKQNGTLKILFESDDGKQHFVLNVLLPISE